MIYKILTVSKVHPLRSHWTCTWHTLATHRAAVFKSRCSSAVSKAGWKQLSTRSQSYVPFKKTPPITKHIFLVPPVFPLTCRPSPGGKNDSTPRHLPAVDSWWFSRRPRHPLEPIEDHSQDQSLVSFRFGWVAFVSPRWNIAGPPRRCTVDAGNPVNSPVEVGRKYPTIYRVLYIQGGAGFQPSTVWMKDVWWQ